MLVILEQWPDLPLMSGETELWNLQIIARTHITQKVVATRWIAVLHTFLDYNKP